MADDDSLPGQPPDPAGWRPDPWFRGQYRWWDGHDWTAEVFPARVGAATATVAPRPLTERPAAPPPARRSAVPPPPPTWSLHRPGPAELATQPTEILEIAPRSRGRVRPAVVAVLLVVLGFIVGAGIELLVDHSAGTAAAPAGAAPNNSSTSPPTPSPGLASPGSVDPAVLQRFGVQQSDLPAGQFVAVLPQGTDISGQPTLDLCNGTFASETRRTARFQVAAATADGSVALSTEAVFYDTPAATAQAFRELQQVAGSCPPRPVVSPVGEDTITTKIVQRPDSSWPHVQGVQRLAYTVTTTDLNGNTETSTVVYLRRGQAMLGVYLPHTSDGRLAASVQGSTTAQDIIAVFENRLAGVPAAAVGA